MIEKDDWYCYMIVAEKTKKNVPMSQNDVKIANRTILGVSKDPFYEVHLWNINGPTRNNSPYSSQFDINGTNVTNMIELLRSHFKKQGKFDYSRISHRIKVTDCMNFDDEIQKEVEKKQSSRKSSRKRVKEGPRYTLAVIIAGFKKDENKARKFCDLWNRNSRGSIPRTALGAVFSEYCNLTIYADLMAAFDHPFQHIVIESHENYFLIQPKNTASKRKRNSKELTNKKMKL